MPDPKGIFEAISRDLEAVGFTINPNTATWRPGLPRRTSPPASTRCGSSAGPATGPGPDNFLNTAFFDYVDGQAVDPSSRYKNDELEQTMIDALAATDEATAKTAVGEGAGPDPRRPPDRPARQLDAARPPPGRTSRASSAAAT